MGRSILQLLDAERLLGHAEIACAMTSEALKANLKLYDERLHRLRGSPGAVTSVRNIPRVMEGSVLEERWPPGPLQARPDPGRPRSQAPSQSRAQEQTQTETQAMRRTGGSPGESTP